MGGEAHFIILFIYMYKLLGNTTFEFFFVFVQNLNFCACCKFIAFSRGPRDTEFGKIQSDSFRKFQIVHNSQILYFQACRAK